MSLCSHAANPSDFKCLSMLTAWLLLRSLIQCCLAPSASLMYVVHCG